MADFHIQQQHAHVIQQAEVINTGVLAWDESSEQLRALLDEVKDLVAGEELDPKTGSELCSAISDAAAAQEKKSRLHALAKASNIATGVSILSGISQTIGQIVHMMPR